jgi:hypothetical protein
MDPLGHVELISGWSFVVGVRWAARGKNAGSARID